ncbi:hypothetical protein L3Q82_000188 [Scortum barcoo]|uniref:Uncharacterized protein n=1 Tax=Scortum barcoo TaxID=214431 RepID=A0ACB8XAD7_9TELE|nr:hypothetical protein L3Q82_000188 [Scortum barcoo]
MRQDMGGSPPLLNNFLGKTLQHRDVLCGRTDTIKTDHKFLKPKNFHLMDYHLAIFITVMLARRLVWTIVSEVSQSSGGSLLRYVFLIAARLCLLTMCGWVLCWTLVYLCKNYSVLNLLFLGYPREEKANRHRHRPTAIIPPTTSRQT